jgi:hypothetical protein
MNEYAHLDSVISLTKSVAKHAGEILSDDEDKGNAPRTAKRFLELARVGARDQVFVSHP